MAMFWEQETGAPLAPTQRIAVFGWVQEADAAGESVDELIFQH